MAGGEYHSLALKSDGTVWAWGRAGNGQLGNGGFADSGTPVQATSVGYKIKAIVAGTFHTLALPQDANQPPTANNDSATVAGDSGANVIEVLVNDSDPDGD